MSLVYTDMGRFAASGLSAETTGGVIVTARGATEVLIWYSASAEGGDSGNASANFAVEHSVDGAQGWTPIAEYTATQGANLTAQYAAGPYSFFRVSATQVYSAAETGTGAVWVFIQPGFMF